MSKSPTESRPSDTAPDMANEPWSVSEPDIAAWAERERKRRQAWLEGPNQEEKQAWADAERLRRKRQYRYELLEYDPFSFDLEEGRRFADRMMAGFTNRMVDVPLRKLGDLLREGRSVESRQKEPLRKRRRVYPDEVE